MALTDLPPGGARSRDDAEGMQPVVGARRVELRQASTWSALRARVNGLRLRSPLVVRLIVTVADPARKRHRTHYRAHVRRAATRQASW